MNIRNSMIVHRKDWIKNLNLTQFKIYMFDISSLFYSSCLFCKWDIGKVLVCLVSIVRTKINGGIQKSISLPFHHERFIYLYYFTLSTFLFKFSSEKAFLCSETHYSFPFNDDFHLLVPSNKKEERKCKEKMVKESVMFE